MVARIRYGRRIEGVLFYNREKIARGDARILYGQGIIAPIQNGWVSVRELAESFRPYVERPGTRVRDRVFHVSLNPHPKDVLSEDQFVEIARRYMRQMGYGDQPYVVYLHRDIDRMHVHVVSTRIPIDGRPISRFNDRPRSMEITRQIERDYGLHPAAESNTLENIEGIRPLVYGSGPLKAQISSLVRTLMDRYDFSSRSEFNTLLGLFGVTVEECVGRIGERSYRGILYSAIDKRGKTVGTPIASSRIGSDVGYKALESRYWRTVTRLKKNPGELDRVREAIGQAMGTAHSAKRFAKLLRAAQITPVFHRNETGRIYGMTFIDHAAGLVINGRRLGKEFSANRFEALWGSVSHHGQYRRHEAEGPSDLDLLLDLFAPDPMPEPDADWVEAERRKRRKRRKL